jgi:hypothetical protein
MNDRPANLHKAIEAAQTLRLEIAKLVRVELTEDDVRAIQDSFDGETTLDAELERALEAEDDDKILIDGIKGRVEDLRGRLERINKRVEARRGLIEQAMSIAGWPRHETPLGTISLAKAPAKVEIDEESDIPSQFFKRQDPVLDKAGLGKVLKERHKAVEAANKLTDQAQRDAKLKEIDREFPPIAGVHLKTDGVQLTIRRK